MNTAPQHTARRPVEVLKDVYGYGEFRRQQAQIIDHVCAGNDALVLMPTGGGKSLCYQIPAIVLDGIGIVVSPLIALMHDQVRALRELGVRAAFLNSSLTRLEQEDVIDAARGGQLDLLYIAPERLLQEETLALLAGCQVALIAIDEAHCVSAWGHDFRQDYLELNRLRDTFPGVPRIALTATADPRTRDDIVKRLELDDPEIFVDGFDRPNICYTVQPKRNPRQQLLSFLTDRDNQSGIVYCLSRKSVESTAAWLTAQGYNALPYHAGLPAEVRNANQERFLRDDAVIIVATIAFGMGIDKPDVRFVAHLDLPKSVEAYYQETGRAGRDGEPADAWMVYGLQDVVQLSRMAAESTAADAHKRIERTKLDAMVGWCEVTACRRRHLLEYFGEHHSADCGNCDICLEPPRTWDGTDAARKALSTVYRTGQRFGAGHVIDVLRGHLNPKVEGFKHDKLSVFGIGKELDDQAWRSIFRQLVVRGLLAVDHDRYGALRLTDVCRPLLRGDTKLTLREDAKPQRRASRKTGATGALLAPSDEPLMEALRDLRRQIATAANVPPYVVFHDATLAELATRKPATNGELLEINGVGQAKLAKYGEPFLEIIRKFKTEAD